MNIILLGPPGSGKGTQAELLCEKYGLKHISPGAIARAGTDELANKMKKYMAKGELAPAKIVMKLIEKHLGQHNLFDGFPRLLDQAEALDELISIDLVIELALPDKEVITRLSSRLECIKCKASYGPAIKPKNPGTCNTCNGELVKRKDDTPTLIQLRLDKYHDETEPLLEYYRPRHIVHTVDGNNTTQPIFKQLCKVIENG